MQSTKETIARLVLGYLRGEKCSSAHKEFLRTSKDLLDESAGKYKRLPTRFFGSTLEDILEEYFKMRQVVHALLESTPYYDEFHESDSLFEQLLYIVKDIPANRSSTPFLRSSSDSDSDESEPPHAYQMTDLENSRVRARGGIKFDHKSPVTEGETEAKTSSIPETVQTVTPKIGTRVEHSDFPACSKITSELEERKTKELELESRGTHSTRPFQKEDVHAVVDESRKVENRGTNMPTTTVMRTISGEIVELIGPLTVLPVYTLVEVPSISAVVATIPRDATSSLATSSSSSHLPERPDYATRALPSTEDRTDFNQNRHEARKTSEQVCRNQGIEDFTDTRKIPQTLNKYENVPAIPVTRNEVPRNKPIKRKLEAVEERVKKIKRTPLKVSNKSVSGQTMRSSDKKAKGATKKLAHDLETPFNVTSAEATKLLNNTSVKTEESSSLYTVSEVDQDITLKINVPHVEHRELQKFKTTTTETVTNLDTTFRNGNMNISPIRGNGTMTSKDTIYTSTPIRPARNAQEIGRHPRSARVASNVHTSTNRVVN